MAQVKQQQPETEKETTDTDQHIRGPFVQGIGVSTVTRDYRFVRSGHDHK